MTIEQFEIDTAIEDILAHHGIKGMRWGVRKARAASLRSLGPDVVTKKMKNGHSVTLNKVKPNKLHRSLAFASGKFAKRYSEGASVTIHDKSGKEIGHADFFKKSKDELYLNWVTIDKSARGHGYGTAVLHAAKDLGGKQGFKKMTLDVPGISPDARHIYEKMGFKVTKEPKSTNDIWGGLTTMEYTFKK